MYRGVNGANLKKTRNAVPGTGWNASYQSSKVREVISRHRNHPQDTLGYRQSHRTPNLGGDSNIGAFVTRRQMVVR